MLLSFKNKIFDKIQSEIVSKLRVVENGLTSLRNDITNNINNVRNEVNTSIDTLRNELIAIARTATPAGAVMYFASNKPPSSGWATCDGKILLKSEYPDLDTNTKGIENINPPDNSIIDTGAIVYTFNNTLTELIPLKDNNGVVVTVGRVDLHNLIKLPDTTNLFIRSSSNTRKVGTYQDDAFKDHKHSGGLPAKIGTTWLQHYEFRTGGWPEKEPSDPTTRFTGSTGSDETRPKNIALLACIYLGRKVPVDLNIIVSP